MTSDARPGRSWRHHGPALPSASLGVTLYEMLTLSPAFDGRDRAEILRRIAEHEARPLRRLNPAVPYDLETVVAKAMDKDAAARYATAGEMAEDLRRYLTDQPVR